MADDGRVVSLGYGDVRLDEFDGRVNEIFFQKFLHADTRTYRSAKVDDTDAIWIKGPHEIWYIDHQGLEQSASAHLSGNTLIWQSGPTALRLEGVPTLPEALRIAESTR
ncbi:hypothetical protein [Actinocorallia longicatena]|uniref:hypothetical protein n=1 Tax=Actinocorallia longicatena TaxID=111803 RepID=UPI0031DF14B7